MAGKNLLVNGKNNITARANAMANIQNTMANRTTASNVNTTPNLPTRPTTVNLQRAQTSINTKLNNLNNATMPTGTITTNNPAFVNGQLTNQNTPSRFIGFQKPKTDLGGNLTSEGIKSIQPKGQSVTSFMKPTIYIPTAQKEIDKENKQYEKEYKENENLIKQLHRDIKNANGQLTKEDIKKKYKQWKGKEDAVLQLQADLRPLIQQGQYGNTQDIQQYYSDLFAPKKKADESKLKEQEEESKKLANAKERADKLLNRYNNLSQNGTKYLEDASQVSDYIDYIRKNYRLPNNPSDSDILAWGKDNIPELKNLLDDMQQLESYGGMTQEDYDVILKNKLTLGELLGDATDFLANNSVSKRVNTNVESGKRSGQLQNLGINGGMADILTKTAQIPQNMATGLTESVGVASTAINRLVNQQNVDENGNTNWAGVDADKTKLIGGLTTAGFYTVGAPITLGLELLNAGNEDNMISEGFDAALQNLDKVNKGEAKVLGLFALPKRYTDSYKNLDEETKQYRLQNELIGLSKIVHAGGSKIAKETGVRLEVANDIVVNSFKRAKTAAQFQTWIEKGLAGEGGKFQKGALGRISRETWGEFKDGIRDGFRLYDTAVKNYKGDITSNMNTLPDNRTFREKAESKFNQAKETVNEGINTVKEGVNNVVDTTKQGVNNVVEGVQNIKPGEIIKNTAETVGKGVKATSDLIDSGKNAVTQGKNAVTNAIKENVVDPFKKGYEGVKNTVNENIIEPYNQGRGKTNRSLNGTEISQQGTQQLKSNPTSVTDNKINGDNYTQKNTNSKPLNNVQLRTIQSYNRMNPKTADTFKERYGEDYGQFLADRGFTKSADGGNLNDMVEYKKDLLENKNELLNTVEGTFKDQAINDMIDHIVEYVVDTVDRKNEKRFKTLQEKANNEGLTMSEINEMRQWYSYHVKTGFFKEQNAKGLQKATNIYDNLKDFLDKVGEERGLTSLREINREIMKIQHIIGGVSYKMNAQGGNNLFGLTDYVLGATLSNPETVALFLAKQVAKMPTVKNAVANTVVGRRENAKNRITKESKQGEKENIKKINEEKKQQAEQEKKAEAGRQLQQDLSKSDTKALPNKGGTDGGKNILTNGKTIITDARGNSKVKGQISEIDNRVKKSDSSSSGDGGTPTGGTPTNNQGGTETPKNKVTSKPKKSTKSVDKKNTNEYNTEDKGSPLQTLVSSQKGDESTRKTSFFATRKNERGKDVLERIKNGEKQIIESNAKNKDRFSNNEELEYKSEWNPYFDNLNNVIYGDKDVGKIGEVDIKGAEKDIVIDDNSFLHVFDKHGEFNKKNLISTVNDPDYKIIDVKTLDKQGAKPGQPAEYKPVKDKINLIKELPSKKGFLIVGANYNPKKGYYVATHFEVVIKKGNELSEYIDKGTPLDKKTENYLKEHPYIEQPKNAITSKKSAVTDYINETPQNERGQLEEIEAEENLRSNETPQDTVDQIINEEQYLIDTKKYNPRNKNVAERKIKHEIPKEKDIWTDSNGEEVTFYHGTPQGGFEEFSMAFRGKSNDRVGNGDYGRGMYFTPYKETAEGYAKSSKAESTNPEIYETKLRMENPLRLDLYKEFQRAMNKLAKEDTKRGYSLLSKEHSENIDRLMKEFGLTEELYDKYEDIISSLGDNRFDVDIRGSGFDGIISEDGKEVIVPDTDQIIIQRHYSTNKTEQKPKNKVTAKKAETTSPKQEENQTKKFTYDEYGQVMNKIGEVEKKINDKLDKQYEQERAEKMSRFEELRDKEDKTDAEGKELVKLQGELNNMSNKYDKLKEDELKKQAPELLQQKEELQQAFDRDWKAAMDKKMEEMEKPFNDLRDEFRQKLRDELGIADDVILDEKYYNSLTPAQKETADRINKEFADRYEELRKRAAGEEIIPEIKKAVEKKQEKPKKKQTKKEEKEARARGLAKPDGNLIYSSGERKYVPSLKEGLIRLTKEEGQKKFKEQLGNAFRGGLEITVREDNESPYYDADRFFVYNPDREGIEEWEDRDIEELTINGDNIKEFEVYNDGDVDIIIDDPYIEGKDREIILDLKDFLNYSNMTRYIDKEHPRNLLGGSKNKVTSSAPIDTFEDLDFWTIKELKDRGDQAAIDLYEEMGIEDDALEELYKEMLIEENETPQRPSIFDEELETERQLSENETAQTPTIFEEDLEQMNLRELEENETPQADEEEKTKIVDKDGKPLRVYHGTNMEGDEYGDIRTEPGYWFTEDRDYAKTHSEKGIVREANLDMKKPINIDEQEEVVNGLLKDAFGDKAKRDDEHIFSKEFKNAAIKKGYDGLIFSHDDANTYIVFNKDQIIPLKPQNVVTDKANVTSKQAENEKPKNLVTSRIENTSQEIQEIDKDTYFNDIVKNLKDHPREMFIYKDGSYFYPHYILPSGKVITPENTYWGEVSSEEAARNWLLKEAEEHSEANETKKAEKLKEIVGKTADKYEATLKRIESDNPMQEIWTSGDYFKYGMGNNQMARAKKESEANAEVGTFKKDVIDGKEGYRIFVAGTKNEAIRAFYEPKTGKTYRIYRGPIIDDSKPYTTKQVERIEKFLQNVDKQLDKETKKEKKEEKQVITQEWLDSLKPDKDGIIELDYKGDERWALGKGKEALIKEGKADGKYLYNYGGAAHPQYMALYIKNGIVYEGRKGLEDQYMTTKQEAVDWLNQKEKDVEHEGTERYTQTDYETLPKTISVESEAEKAGPKRIAPDRVKRQQETYDQGLESVKNVLKQSPVKIYELGFKSDRSKAVQNILEERKRIRQLPETEAEPQWNELAKSVYEDLVIKDISKGYRYPEDVTSKFPKAQMKKAVDARARYEKGLFTSFSAKDTRANNQYRDEIGAGIKSQDGKPVTQEQMNEIVDGIRAYSNIFGVDMKKFAEDNNVIYVHLHGGNPFLMGGMSIAGLYRRDTAGNISVSLGGREGVMEKGEDGKMKKSDIKTTTVHEITHAVDGMLEGKLFSDADTEILKKTMNKPSELINYYNRKQEIVARAVEQYAAHQLGKKLYRTALANIDWENGSVEFVEKEANYVDREAYWNQENFDKYVKPIVEKNMKEKMKDYMLENTRKNVLANDKNKITSGKTQAAKSYSPTIVMRLDENGNPLSNSKNKVTSRSLKPGVVKLNNNLSSHISEAKSIAQKLGYTISQSTHQNPTKIVLDELSEINGQMPKGDYGKLTADEQRLYDKKAEIVEEIMNAIDNRTINGTYKWGIDTKNNNKPGIVITIGQGNKERKYHFLWGTNIVKNIKKRIKLRPFKK